MPESANVRSAKRASGDPARLACLTLGSALLVWGLALPVIERVVTGYVPGGTTFAAAGAAVLMGATYLGLHRLIRRRVRWALGAAFVLSLAIVTVAVGTVVCGEGRLLPSFLSVFGGFATFSTWLGLKRAPAVAVARPEPDDAGR